MFRTLVVALAAISAFAQAPPRVGVGVTQTKLSLADAVELALRHNLDIEIERTNTVTARQIAKGSLGYLDPSFRWLPSVESRNTPTGSVLAAADGKTIERFIGQNFYFRQRLPWQGMSLHVDFENLRTSTNNPFVSLNPYINSRLLAGVTLPLVRDRKVDRERTDLIIRRKQVNISDGEFELKVIDVVTRVELAYWDLVAARQDTQVTFDNVEWAREQLSRTQRQIQSGSLAPVELSAAEAELERRMDTWFSSLGTLTEVENNLKSLIAGSREDPVWGDEIIPTADHPMTPPANDDLRQLVAEALAKRAELKLVGMRKEVNDTQKRYAIDQTKPQMNVVAGYGSTGLAGSALTGDNPFSASNRVLYDRLNQISTLNGLSPIQPAGFGGIPGGLVGGYSSVLSNLFSGNYQTFQAGVQLDWTMRNRSAEAGVAQAVIGERRLKLEQARTEQVIQAQVRNSLQAIQTAKQRIAAADASARAAKEKLDSEVRLFQTGESTNFLVLTRQNEYADSRRRLVVANLDFNKAVARLEMALGTTLEANKVNLQ